MYKRQEVDWPDEATVKIIKKDKGSNALLAGAVYGIYADEACTKLIKKMPATNAKGESEVKITKTQDTVYLREISGPSGNQIILDKCTFFIDEGAICRLDICTCINTVNGSFQFPFFVGKGHTIFRDGRSGKHFSFFINGECTLCLLYTSCCSGISEASWSRLK